MKHFFVTALCAALAAPALAQNTFGDAQRTQPAPQAPPQQQQQPQQNNTRPPQQAAGGNSKLDQLMAVERQDFGVPATQQLHNGPMHGETPTSIPGGQLITTKGLNALVNGKQAPFVMLDVLGSGEMLPGAVQASWASQPGSFSDQIQQQFGQMLQQVTRGNKQMPLVLYCLSPHCWMSYNASLRAINLGYSNVLWYRGGVEAWKAAGFQTSGGGNGAPSGNGGFGNDGG